jgi:hypothetical protein
LPRRSNLDTFVSRAGKIFNFFEVFFGPDRGKNCVFLVSIEEKFVFFGQDRLFYIMLFNVMISRFFTKKQRERENREKKAGKRETATTLLWIMPSIQ